MSEEQLRQYLSQLRGAKVDEIVAQFAQMLIEAAQVKIGRNDGRLLVDLLATVRQAIGSHLDSRLNDQLSQVVSQLQMAQVQAEREIAEARAKGEDVDEPNDLPVRPQTGAPTAEGAPSQAEPDQEAQGQPSPQQTSSRSSAGSRLWVPGR